jgi:hypothetical protein
MGQSGLAVSCSALSFRISNDELAYVRSARAAEVVSLGVEVVYEV